MSSDELFIYEKMADQQRERDRAAAIDARPIVVQASRATAYSINNGVPTPINFDTTSYDTAGAVVTTPNWRFHPPVAGFYNISAYIGLDTADADWSVGDLAYLYLAVNGAVVRYLAYHQNFGAAAGMALHGAITPYYLTQYSGGSGYVEIYVYQGSGGLVNVNFGSDSCWVSIERVAGKTRLG